MAEIFYLTPIFYSWLDSEVEIHLSDNYKIKKLNNKYKKLKN